MAAPPDSAKKALERTCEDVKKLGEMLILVDELERKILDETAPSWDYRVGIEEQRVIRQAQQACCQHISDCFDIQAEIEEAENNF
jgi:hypothetical protein